MSDPSLIYFNQAATSWPKPEVVMQAVDQALRQGGNPGRGNHGLALAAAHRVESAREAVARFLGLKDPSRLIFSFNATDALNMALFGVLRPGDRVLFTPLEHNSVLRPLQVLRRRRGIHLQELPLGQEGHLDLDQAGRLLQRRTRLVVVNHASNVTGQIQDVRRLGELARREGALLLVDAAQTAGVLPFALDELQADMLAFTGHKGLLGPTGTGGLCLAAGLELDTWRVGGTGNLSHQELPPQLLPERLEAGTHNVCGLAGLEASVTYLGGLEPGEVLRHESRLRERLYRGLLDIPGVRPVGPPPTAASIGVLSLLVEGMDPALVEYRLEKECGIICRTGLHCAPRAHRSWGTFPRGTVRLSPGWFNTEAEVDAVVQALGKVVAT